MFRIVSVALTIAALVACPYNCLGSWAGGRATAEEASECRCCPQHRQPAEDTASCSSLKQDAPATPCQDCQCGSCLCRGAVLPKHDLSLEIAAQTHFDVERATVAVGPVGPETDRLWRADANPPPLAPSGRLVRLAVRSLQV